MASATNGTLTSVHANGTSTSNPATAPKIHLYTNHACPFAHRAHIVLEELGLPFEETIIDLNTPRPQWYLDINPRGLVPSIKYSVPGFSEKEEILYESSVVAQFLADAFPSPLLPSSHESPLAPLTRARVNFFVDTWSTKLSTYQTGVLKAPTAAEKLALVDEWVGAVEREIEPLLADAGPFFGGSKEITLAEAMVAPFLLRWYGFAEGDAYVPRTLAEKLDALPNFGGWSKAVRAHASVLKVWEPEVFMEGFLRKYGKVFVSMKGE